MRQSSRLMRTRRFWFARGELAAYPTREAKGSGVPQAEGQSRYGLLAPQDSQEQRAARGGRLRAMGSSAARALVSHRSSHHASLAFYPMPATRLAIDGPFAGLSAR